jgi:hypothetical protein
MRRDPWHKRSSATRRQASPHSDGEPLAMALQRRQKKELLKKMHFKKKRIEETSPRHASPSVDPSGLTIAPPCSESVVGWTESTRPTSTVQPASPVRLAEPTVPQPPVPPISRTSSRGVESSNQVHNGHSAPTKPLPTPEQGTTSAVDPTLMALFEQQRREIQELKQNQLELQRQLAAGGQRAQHENPLSHASGSSFNVVNVPPVELQEVVKQTMLNIFRQAVPPTLPPSTSTWDDNLVEDHATDEVSKHHMLHPNTL